MRKIWKPYVVLNKENHITGIYYYKENALKNMTQDGQCGYYTIPTDILVPQGRIGKIKADLFYLVIEFTEQEICLRGLFKSREELIMANRIITEEQKVQINELYYENHNKALTARTLGISPASVTKYLIEGYVPIAQREEIHYDIAIHGADNFIKDVFSSLDSEKSIKMFTLLCRLSNEEANELTEMKKTIYA